MNSLLPFIVVGVASGAVYGMAGVGLVLTYKTSGIFNFAHGAIATAAAYGFYYLHVKGGMAWPPAAVICLVVFGLGMGLVFEPFARGISRAALVWRIVATVGVLLIVEGVCTIISGATNQPYPHFLSQTTFRLAGTNVTYESLILTVTSIVITAALYAFFRFARLGTAMRAVVDDPDLLALGGTTPALVRRFAWIIGCFMAALSGILLAPSVGLQAESLTLLVVQAFGAAALGRFSSLPLTWTGGLAIGLVSSLATKYITAGSILGGLPASVPFLALFLVLLLARRDRLAGRDAALIRRPAPWSAPGRVQLVGGVVAVVLLCLVPNVVGFELIQWTTALCAVVLFLSLGLLTRTSGQVSLCHAGFAAVGAVAFSKLTAEAHIPWIPALLIAGLIVVPIGALVAIPAIRLSGLSLALATFGFGLLLQNMFYQSSWMFGSNSAGLIMPLPHLSWLTVDSDKGFYYVVLVITLLVALLVVAIDRSRMGRLLRGISDSPTALLTGGTNVAVTRLMVFCVSAYLAGISGALTGATLGYASGVNFDPLNSLTYVALIIIAMGGLPWYALVAGGGLILIPGYFTSENTSNYLQIAFGAGAILAALGPQATLPAAVRSVLDRLGGRTRTAKPARPARADGQLAPAADARAPERPDTRPLAPLSLRVRDLEVRFGGLVAVQGLSLEAPSGRITGLIGPNGAGKTTTFNACSGLNHPSRGAILLGDADVSRLGPSGRARRGLGRTFQQPELFDSLNVLDNVALGREAGMAGANPVSQLLARPAERRSIEDSAWRALEACGLTELAGRQVGSLSTGQRRLVELARGLAGPYGLLLLDEPSAGLDREETEQFGRILTRVVAERGIGILLVEHDMALVMDICTDIYVMDFGRLIFHGSPAEVQHSELVRTAYLGTEADEPGTLERETAAVAEAADAGTGDPGPLERHAVAVTGTAEVRVLERSPAPGGGPRAGTAPTGLELLGISAGYGQARALEDVSVSVPASSIVALLGANGAGKTTTMRVASGLLRPRRGRVLLGGADISGLSAPRRARAGLCLIPEGRGIFRSLTVRENLLLQVPEWRKDTGIEPALEMFPILRQRLHQVAGSLSGGQQQMLALSRAHIAMPKVVLLDEVSLGLAPVVVDEIFESLVALAAGGASLLVVEQYVSRVLALSHRVCLLARGEVVWQGPVADLDDETLTAGYLGHAV